MMEHWKNGFGILICWVNWKVTIGGARLPRGLAKQASDLGIELHAGYGMSETCPVMATASPKEDMLDRAEDKLLVIIIKTGKPIPLAEVDESPASGS